jgi:hypothetical protein
MDLRPVVAAAILLFGTGINGLLHSPGNPKEGASDQTGALSTSSVEGIVYVDGVKYAKTDAGIQAAVNATPAGGTIILPPATYTLTGTGSEEILITLSIHFICSGWGTVLQVGTSVPSTTDIIHIKPTSLVQGGRIQDCYITAQRGTPGRYGINIDGANAQISNLVIEHNRINQLGSYAIAETNSSRMTTGNPFTTAIRDNMLVGGVNLPNAGDSVNVEDNVLTGPRGLLVNQQCISCSDGGAHGLRISGNNITSAGGTVIQNAWTGVFENNNVEQTADTTEVNGALLDLQGSSSTPTQNFKVIGNYLGCNLSYHCVNAIRVDRMVATQIRDNYVARGNGASYLITSNADRTQLILNRQAPSGELISTWLSDSGNKTQVDYVEPNTGVRELLGLGCPLNQRSSAYTLTVADCLVNVTGTTAITVNPALSSTASSLRWVVFNTGSGTVTVSPSRGRINGAASITLAANTGKEVTCDGTNCWAR